MRRSDSPTRQRRRIIKWDIDKTQKLIQIIAILVGGLWILYEYIDYKRQANKLGVVLAELNTKSEEQNIGLKEIQLRYADEQQKTLQQQQKLQIELDKINILDKEKDSKLKAIELQYADQQHRIQQQQASLAIDIARLNISTQKTEGELKGLELKNAQERNMKYAYNLSLKKKSKDKTDNAYLATLHFELKNTGKTDLEVTYTIVEYFTGSTGRATLGTEQARVMRIGSPPSIVGVPRNIGGIVWSKIGYDAQRTGTGLEIMRNDFRLIGEDGRFRFNFDVGGGATGIWKAGEETYFNKVYEIVADPNGYIAFVINMCFNKCQDPVDFWYFPYSRAISEAEQNNDSALAQISK